MDLTAWFPQTLRHAFNPPSHTTDTGMLLSKPNVSAAGAAIDERMAALGMDVCAAPPPPQVHDGHVKAYTRHGDVVYVGATVPRRGDGTVVEGLVGCDFDIPMARNAARTAGMNLLHIIKDACDGDLGRLRRILHIDGTVKATPDFTSHGAVLDACSDVFVDVLGGDVGKHARSAAGVLSLPHGAAVQVGCICVVADTAEEAGAESKAR